MLGLREHAHSEGYRAEDTSWRKGNRNNEIAIHSDKAYKIDQEKRQWTRDARLCPFGYPGRKDFAKAEVLLRVVLISGRGKGSTPADL